MQNETILFLWAYHNIVHSISGLATYQTVYGRVAHESLSILHYTWSQGDKVFAGKKQSYAEHLEALKSELQFAAVVAEQKSQASQDMHFDTYYKTLTTREFSVGEKVLLLLSTSKNHLFTQCTCSTIFSENWES